MINITLIRHGKTEANKRKAYLGITDEPLSEEGIAELEGYKKNGKYPKADIVYTSPMIRCRQTAEILYPETSVNIVEEFAEINFGIFEMKNYKDLEDSIEYRKWVDSMCTSKIPKGESLQKFICRTRNGLKRITPELQSYEDEAEVVFVVHGGTIMSLLSGLTGKDYYDFQVENGLGYRVGGGFDNEQKMYHSHIEKL